MDDAEYHAGQAPANELVRFAHALFSINVHSGPRGPFVGDASLCGWVPDEKGGPPVAIYKMAIAGRRVPGLWTCDAGRFVRIEP